MESAGPDLAVERVVESDDAHADVVRHERAHDRLSRAGRRPRVVERVAETEWPERALCFQRSEILESLPGLDDHRQQRGVRSNHQLLAEAALEREIRHSKAAILVGVRSVAHRVRGL